MATSRGKGQFHCYYLIANLLVWERFRSGVPAKSFARVARECCRTHANGQAISVLFVKMQPDVVAEFRLPRQGYEVAARYTGDRKKVEKVERF